MSPPQSLEARNQTQEVTLTALAETIGKRDTRTVALATDALLILTGSLFVAGMAQLYLKLPFTPVPITGQTLAVLLVGGALGAVRGGSSMLLYLGWIAIGLPFAAEGKSGAEMLGVSTASGGYLWGFVVAAVVVGWLSERGWDRDVARAWAAMLIGSIIIYLFGIPWLAAALDVPMAAELGSDALSFGFYPFVIGDIIKLLIAGVALPAAWRIAGKR
jgi:biotin transport system substrate-specific component